MQDWQSWHENGKNGMAKPVQKRNEKLALIERIGEIYEYVISGSI